jgi:hypothetical protein
MKSRILKTSTGSLIFLLLVVAVIALINPLYDSLNSLLTSKIHSITGEIREKTGISVTYDSLSPSVLSGISIKGIKLSDYSTGKDLVYIKRATFSYRFRELFSKNPLKAVKLLLLDGVEVEYDAVKDNGILENLKLFFGDDGKEEKKEKKDSETSRIITLAGKEININFDIQFKNISIHYSDSKNDLLVSVKNVLLEKNMRIKESVQLKTSGRIDFRTHLVKTADYRKLFAAGFELSGTLFKNLDGSSFLLKLKEINRADYTLSRMDLLLNYGQSRLSFRTMRNSLPYSLLAEADFDRQYLTLDANADNFEILKLIKIKNNSRLYSKFAGTRVTLSLKAGSLFSSPEAFEESLKFALKGKCSLSKNVLSSPASFFYDISCADRLVTFNRLAAEGKRAGIEFTGNYNIKTSQPSGVLSIDHLVLENGGTIQTEVYIDPYKNGFMCFAPQLFMDDRSLTALQLTVLPSEKSADFIFEFDDYSHPEYEQSGHGRIDGSYIKGRDSVVQANVSMKDMFLDSVLNTAAFFMSEESSSSLSSASKSLQSWIFSDDLYFTTDFKSFTFNSPYFILANTQREKELVTFSLDGSNQTVTLSGLDLQYGNNTAHVSAGIDFSSGLSDFNFYTQIVLNSLPYSLSGSCSQKFLSISGDYNFASMVNLEKGFSGSLEFSSMPLAFGKNIFSASLTTSFNFSKNGFEAEISNFDFADSYGSLRLKPHFAFSGSVNRYGFVMNKMAYSDIASALDGKMNIVWNINEGIFDSILVDFTAQSILNSEKITLNAELKNPEKKVLDAVSLKNDFYVSAQGSLVQFPSARLLSDQNSENTVNADFSVTGTLTNPFFNLNLLKASVNIGGSQAVAKGFAVYDDSGFSASDVKLNWGSIKVDGFNAFFEPRSFTGDFRADISGAFLDLDFKIPLKASVKSLVQGKNEADNILLTLTSDKMTGSFFPSGQKLDLLITKTPDKISFISSGGRGITGEITEGKYVSAKSGPDSPLGFDLTGSIINNQLDLNAKNLRADMGRFCQAVSIPYVNFTAGTMAGALKISGITTDPEYTGAVTVTKPEFYVPFVSKKLFRSERVFATAGQGHFTVKPTKFTLDKNPVSVGLDIEFDRWGVNYLKCPIQTASGEYIPVDIGLPFIHYKGYGGFDNFNIAMTKDDVTFTGKIIGEKADIEVIIEKESQDSSENSDGFDYIVDLDLLVKNRVQILYNPLLRGVIVPDNSLKLYIDTRTNDFGARGEVNLRGGEIIWLNRNFYMKEGKVTFNETKELFDPRITVRAETRSRDEDNNQITIILSATGQALSQFNPHFTSTPARSETEIMALLGQVISADAQNAASLVMAGGDYLMQATVVRGLENTLRELLNFDIFSIRTNILQNAVKQSMDKNSASKQITFSNFFDNSAVYVGKYFGNAMYVDALMHWSYDETKVGDSDTSKGLVFQPEFGLEMNSPYVNIRLGVAPELEAIKQSLWMPSTSITLSWKHSF